MRRDTSPQVVPGEVGSEAVGAVPSGDPRWYIVVSSLLVAFGGVVVPVLGWAFGIAMVWMSKTWRRWEKWTASLVPVLLGAAIAFTLVAIRNVNRGELTGGTSSVPAFFDAWWFGLLLTLGLNVLAGGWLLWRARRRR